MSAGTKYGMSGDIAPTASALNTSGSRSGSAFVAGSTAATCATVNGIGQGYVLRTPLIRELRNLGAHSSDWVAMTEHWHVPQARECRCICPGDVRCAERSQRSNQDGLACSVPAVGDLQRDNAAVVKRRDVHRLSAVLH